MLGEDDGPIKEATAAARMQGAARVMLAVVVLLVVLKVVVVVITGSVSILAQAVDSAIDLLAVVITMVAVRIATRPADAEHPFGHGKVENVAAVTQAGLIFTTAGFIIYSAVNKIISGAGVELAEAGIAVMFVSMVSSIFLSRFLFRTAGATDSIALQASAHNIAVDVYSAAAVLAGLIAVRLTGLSILDPIIALAVSVLILRTGLRVLWKSFRGLMDVKLPQAEEDEIRAIIIEHNSQLVAFHDLRTRMSGSYRYVDLHLVMPKHASVEEAHRVCDHLETDIGSKLPRIYITIHVEPCATECQQCSVDCTLKDG